MYEGDSFFTLTLWGRVGLVAVSLCLATMTIWMVARIAKGKALVKRMAIAIGVFYAFLWLSPQVHYFYYMTIFDGLPWQVVVKSPPSPVRVLSVLSLLHDHTLSAHTSGILGWVLIGTAFGQR